MACLEYCRLHKNVKKKVLPNSSNYVLVWILLVFLMFQDKGCWTDLERRGRKISYKIYKLGKALWSAVACGCRCLKSGTLNIIHSNVVEGIPDLLRNSILVGMMHVCTALLHSSVSMWRSSHTLNTKSDTQIMCTQNEKFVLNNWDPEHVDVFKQWNRYSCYFRIAVTFIDWISIIITSTLKECWKGSFQLFCM